MNLVIYLIIINILAFIMFGYDKKKAIKKEYRISESTLIYMTLLSGGIGSILAMKIYKHKTKKKKFWIIAIISFIIWLKIIWLIYFK